MNWANGIHFGVTYFGVIVFIAISQNCGAHSLAPQTLLQNAMAMWEVSRKETPVYRPMKSVKKFYRFIFLWNLLVVMVPG